MRKGGISSAIAEMLITGRWSQLEPLRGGAEPEALLGTVPREGQCTVLTQARGRHAGERVVRGREAECLSRAA